MTTEQEQEEQDDLFKGDPTLEPIDWSKWSTVPPHLRDRGESQEPPNAEQLNAALGQMMEQAKPDVPMIEEPPSGMIELLWGIERDGRRYRTALVRELNGVDEETIARLPTNAANYNVMVVDVHLRCGVTRIGPIDVASDPAILGELLIPDRDILFKEILLATYGNHRDYEGVPCPTCGFEMDLHVDFEGLIKLIKPRDFDSDNFVVTLRDGSPVLMRYVNGNDQLSIFRNATKSMSTPEANTAFIAACIEKVNGKPVANPEKWARELGILDRTKIVNALLDVPSIGFKEVEVPCQKCGEPLPTVFGWADLLPK